jgi:hypothetical protein
MPISEATYERGRKKACRSARVWEHDPGEDDVIWVRYLGPDPFA